MLVFPSLSLWVVLDSSLWSQECSCSPRSPCGWSLIAPFGRRNARVPCASLCFLVLPSVFLFVDMSVICLLLYLITIFTFLCFLTRHIKKKSIKVIFWLWILGLPFLYLVSLPFSKEVITVTFYPFLRLSLKNFIFLMVICQFWVKSDCLTFFCLSLYNFTLPLV